jgi:multiple sugar transport system ATP-binding protein
MSIMSPSGTHQSAVELRDATKRFGKKEALKNLELSVREGECLVVAGPSGAGKTTLLRVVAGLEQLDGGDVLLEGRSCRGLGAWERRTGMTFESYALYPHLSVAQNIAFPLRSKRPGATPLSEADIEGKVRRMAAMLRIDPLLDRRTDQLSGGQRQRVALARCLVRDAIVYLLDEPLFKRMVGALNATLIYVTHDYREAMALGDRIAILEEGRLAQVGTPTEIFDEPATRFVATFAGDPPINLIEGVVEDGQVRIGVNGSAFHVGQVRSSSTTQPGSGPIWVGVRPMDCLVDGSPGGIPGLVKAVKVQEDGSGTVLAETPSGLMEASLGTASTPKFGDRVHLRLDTERVLLFDHRTDSLVGRISATET